MQTHTVHQLVHDEGSACHIARILHQRDEEVEYQDLRQEHDDSPHSADDAVYQHRAQRTVGHVAAHPFAQLFYPHLYPVHRVLSQHEGRLEHQEQDGEEDGESQPAVRQHAVYHMRHPVGVALMACRIVSLRQRTVYESVFRIHDSRFRVGIRLFIHTGGGLVALYQNHLAALAGLLADEVLNVRIMLQQLQRHIACRVAGMNRGVRLQVLLDVAYAVFYLVTIVDVQVSRRLAGAFIHLYHRLEQPLHTHSALERRGHHRRTEQRLQHLQVQLVASFLKLIIHVQRTHYRQVHVHQLGGQVEVTLYVRRVYHVDDDVGHLFRQVLAHIQLLRRVARQRIRAGQVGQVELIAEVSRVSHRCVYRHTAVVAHMSVSP